MMMMMMAKPVKPKTLKPKMGSEGGGSGFDNNEGDETSVISKATTSGGTSGLLSIVILSVVMLFSSVAGPVAALYFLGPTLLAPIIAKVVPKHVETEGSEAITGTAFTKVSPLGLNLALDEFTVNLKKDPALRGTQYLRSKMNLSVIVPEAESCSPKKEASGEHGEKPAEGGEHGATPAVPVDLAKACNEAFVQKMTPFVPTLRDIVNTALMKRSAAQIGTLEGQELLKDEMSQEMNNILGTHHYQVVRVNFEEFIVQR
jgi:flagellar basal body-associated protein FliL